MISHLKISRLLYRIAHPLQVAHIDPAVYSTELAWRVREWGFVKGSLQRFVIHNAWREGGVVGERGGTGTSRGACGERLLWGMDGEGLEAPSTHSIFSN